MSGSASTSSTSYSYVRHWSTYFIWQLRWTDRNISPARPHQIISICYPLVSSGCSSAWCGRLIFSAAYLLIYELSLEYSWSVNTRMCWRWGNPNTELQGKWDGSVGKREGGRRNNGAKTWEWNRSHSWRSAGSSPVRGVELTGTSPPTERRTVEKQAVWGEKENNPTDPKSVF